MLALHSSDFVMFFSGFLLACTRVQIPGTSVCLLYSKQGRSFPYRLSDIVRQHIRCLFLHQGSLWAQPTSSLLSQEKSFSSKATAEPKVAPPAVYHGQFKYIARVRRFIGNGKIQLSGCYSTNLTQNYSGNAFPNKILLVKKTLNLFQQWCSQSDGFQICWENYSAFLKLALFLCILSLVCGTESLQVFGLECRFVMNFFTYRTD